MSISLLENLLAENINVNILTDQINSWVEKTEHLSNKSKFSITSEEHFTKDKDLYNIIVAGFLQGNPYEKINSIFRKYNLEKSKNFLLIPFEKYSLKEKQKVSVPDNIGIVYLGDLLGPRLDKSSDLLMPNLIDSVYYKKKVSLAVGEVLHPIFISDAVRTLKRWLFSFGPFGKESLLVGPQISASDFWKVNSEIFPDIRIDYDVSKSVRKLPAELETNIIPCNLKTSLEESYRWIKESKPVVENVVSKDIKKTIKPKTPKVKKKYPKFLKPAIITLTVLSILPLLILFISSGLIYLSYVQFLRGNDKLSENLLFLSKTFLVVSREESKALSNIPVLGNGYREASFVSGFLVRFADIGISAIPALRTGSNLADKIFGNKVYDPTEDSVRLKTNLEVAGRETSVLQAEVKSAISSNLYTAKVLESKVDLEKLKNLSVYGADVAGQLPDILGKGKTKTYLILFQNNMELRPTGGFIGSFGILTFDGGRITDLTVNDVYSADGQLNGHVEPPIPIKQYLGEANWWLRDSNWDPDFPTSAKRAEWFLDKEMGKTVDGVVAIDLYLVKEILKYTGPVFLSDFNEEISSANLYEKTQEEVHENFFPGSRKKQSFLTALSRSLLSEISKLKTDQKTGILRSFYNALNGRHLQVFMHNSNIQSSIASLMWDGSVAVPVCGEGCYADFVGSVEANLGVNKSNYFIERKQEIFITTVPNRVERTLNITLKNVSNPALGPSGIYKTYLRIIVPKDTEIGPLDIYTGATREKLNPDISEVKGWKEIGVWLEVMSTQTKKLEFKWATTYPEGNLYSKYGLYIRKQAGVGDDPISLTVNGKNVYNSTLSGDFFERFVLKK